ncbi:MAG TPA: GPR endopeptidase [Eubacteriales bacterium]|nr:GPR endopeptidase [Eubacteriales bacterium]
MYGFYGNGDFFTDMAVEAFERAAPFGIEKKSLPYGITKSVVRIVTEEEAQRLNRKRGLYISFDTEKSFFRTKDCERALVNQLAQSLSELTAFRLQRGKTALVAGLGNQGMTADSLGPKVLGKLEIDEAKDEKRRLATLAPGVKGVTGIESFDVIKGVVDRLKPAVVIAVDTLACSRSSRLYSSFQISTAGVIPGGGVGNDKRPLDFESLGVPVISLGVPLVLYARTLVSESIANYAERVKSEINSFELAHAISESLFGDYNLVVTPKEIDLIVENSAEILARAINKAFS